MNRTAAANPRRVFVFVDYRPLSGEGGGRGGVGWGLGEEKKKVTDQRVQGLVKKKEFQPTMLSVSRRTKGENVLYTCGLLRRKEGGRRSGRHSPDYNVLMWNVSR